MSQQKTLRVGRHEVGNEQAIVLFAGLNVLESEQLALDTAGAFVEACAALDMPYVFKASFDKANRSSLNSFRGPGLDAGLKILQKVKSSFDVPLITDVHEPWQAAQVAEVVDVLQLPAFLSRQTDLVRAIAETGAVINIKKAQFLAPHEMRHILQKCEEAGNSKLMLCERGTMFGYNNLVVDMLGFETLKSFGYPVIFDVTHALQKPGGLADAADGRRQQVLQLMRAGVVQGLAGLFLEAHPNPAQAKCDGPCALPLVQLQPFLEQVKQLDTVAKQLPDLAIE